MSETVKKERKGGFKKKQPGETADPNIWRGGRGYYNFNKVADKENVTYKDLGRVELLRLFRKMKPHTKEAISVIAELMLKTSADDATRLRAATTFLNEYRMLSKEIYDSDEEVNPESEMADNKPAAVLHLQVVNRLDDAIKKAEKDMKTIEEGSDD